MPEFLYMFKWLNGASPISSWKYLLRLGTRNRLGQSSAIFLNCRQAYGLGCAAKKFQRMLVVVTPVVGLKSGLKGICPITFIGTVYQV